MRFTKMQGLGNDYVYIEDRDWRMAGSPDKKALAIRLSDRHFGIGGDGVIFINPAENADFEMEMYNADGSRGAMCGNGIRCVGKYVYDHGLTDKLELSIESMGIPRYLRLIPFPGVTAENALQAGSGHPHESAASANAAPAQPAVCRRRIDQVTVDMGRPEGIEEFKLTIQDKEYEMTGLSMGNPHAVTLVPSVKAFPVVELGPLFENHPHFPDRTNTEFIELLDRENVRMRVYERGSGETMACGTGACAAGVALIRKGLTDNELTVHLPGGPLRIFWDGEGSVFMTGEAREVFAGEIGL